MAKNVPATTEKHEVAENAETLRTVAPAADIYETKDGYKLLAEVPGAGQDDINLSVEEDTLRMEARASHYEHDKIKYVRDFRVGKGVNLDNIEATLRHGVLVIHLPKAAEAQPKRIPILSNQN